VSGSQLHVTITISLLDTFLKKRRRQKYCIKVYKLRCGQER
jgi:hypothetical protein